MSGGLFVSALLRETGRTLSDADIAMLQEAHGEEYLAQVDSVRPLPGATALLTALTGHGVSWAIATSGYRSTAKHALGMLGLPADTPMITRDMVRRAKPDPDTVPRRGRPARRRPARRDGGRRQRLGSARGAPGRGDRHRADVRRLRPRGT